MQPASLLLTAKIIPFPAAPVTRKPYVFIAHFGPHEFPLDQRGRSLGLLDAHATAQTYLEDEAHFEADRRAGLYASSKGLVPDKVEFYTVDELKRAGRLR